jgi:chorismate-pyruvate lyase
MTLPERGPDLRELFLLFRPEEAIPRYEIIPAAQVPQPYHDLLVHEHHMTVTVEAHHRDSVDVRILARRHEGDYYARQILLTLHNNGRVVQFGIVRVDLTACSPPVREEILAGKTPFGRILINHNVLRRIEPTAFLRIHPGAPLMRWFGMTESRSVYGRLAYIYYDGQAAVELLEIVAPE